MRCVNCNIIQPTEYNNQPYKQYRSNVIKLLYCNSCKQYIDKYVEYTYILILIELILLRVTAYRHIIYNTNNTIYTVYTLLIVIITYIAIVSQLLYYYTDLLK